MPEPEPQTKPRPARDPQALTSEYHKARKQLMLWAGVLFIWELVGIDLDKIKDAGGNAGAIVGAIKAPQAVPWALLILILYFAFKLRIEWGQCNQLRRQVDECRMDYYSAFIVASAACALYFGQAVSKIQFANAIQRSNRVDSVLSGALLALFIGFMALAFQHVWQSRRRHALELMPAIGTTMGGLLLFVKQGLLWQWFLAGFLSALTLMTVARAGIPRLRRSGVSKA